LSGGTLLVAADGTTAVASDPARDLVWIVDLEPKSVRSSIALQAHDEPGRLVEDAAGLIHVALRGGRAIATLDPRAGIVTMRRDACEEPRGIAYDAKRDLLHVACATGTLLTLPAAGGDPVRRLPLDGDLRDVIVDGDRLLISRFRSAEVLVVGSNGLLLDRWRMNPFPINGALSEPEVAWRTIAAPDGGAIMVHQSASMAAITTNIGGGYGNASSGGCTAIVHSHLSSFSHDGTPSVMMPEISGAVPLDVALTADKRTLAVAVAGNATEGGTLSGLMSAPQIVLTAVTFDHDPAGNNGDRTGGCGTNPPIAQSTSTAQTITAIAFAPNGDLVYQTWDPPTLGIATPTGTSTIVLPGETRKDTGHLVFHRTTSSGLACASCHPEGGEDGHVWNFADLGKRRTQSLRVGVIGTEPFHWGGELADLSALVHDVFERRMSGPPLEEAHVAALAHWLNGLRPWQPAAPADPTSVARGRDLFQSQSVGCASCHAGPKLTNNATVSVGTDAGTNGDAFQVPSLVGVGFRAPYLHDGCAPTLLDRFGPCGGGDRHGVTSSLDQAQLTDLVSYLQSL
jgi:mono/diheme cytochrome c family protein